MCNLPVNYIFANVIWITLRIRTNNLVLVLKDSFLSLLFSSTHHKCSCQGWRVLRTLKCGVNRLSLVPNPGMLLVECTCHLHKREKNKFLSPEGKTRNIQSANNRRNTEYAINDISYRQRLDLTNNLAREQTARIKSKHLIRTRSFIL